MKTHFNALLLSLLSIFFVFSCSDDNDKVELTFKVSATEINYNSSGGSQVIHFVSIGAWSVTSSADWYKVTPISGNNTGTTKIEIIADENKTNEPRTAILTVTSGDKIAQVTINQASKDLLILTKEKYSVTSTGENIVVEFQTNGNYTIDIKNNWITENTNRTISNVSKTFVVAPNTASTTRQGKIEITLGSITETVIVEQAANTVSIPADKTGMESDAMTLASKMKFGWNLGNSLEACGGVNSASETMWGNAKTTQKLIDAVKAAGFNTVRIPCAWSGYIVDNDTYKIDPAWLARVKEVVDYCVNNNMYAILNIHWDGGWRDENPFYIQQEAILKKHDALWQQIAVYFRDYDEHLIFAGTNEVHANTGNAPSTENIDVQLSYNQSFVNTVRATGGRNAWRNLVVQAYNTNIELAVKYLKMPTDNTQNRLMSEVHYYDPWDFCGDENGNKFLWGKDFKGNANTATWGLEDWADDAFASMKRTFVDKGVPVILGEYGAILRSDLPEIPYQNHITSRNYYLNYITSSALKHGLVPIYWDNGNTENFGFGLFDRASGNQMHPDAINAIITASK